MLSINAIRKEIEEYGYCHLKYVRIGNQYRFVYHDGIAHRDMLDLNNERAFSAAYVIIKKDKVEVKEWSMSLKKFPADDDEQNLTKFLDFIMATDDPKEHRILIYG